MMNNSCGQMPASDLEDGLAEGEGNLISRPPQIHRPHLEMMLTRDRAEAPSQGGARGALPGRMGRVRAQRHHPVRPYRVRSPRPHKAGRRVT